MRDRWVAATALRYFRYQALTHPEDVELRYHWPNHNGPERADIYSEVIDLIPEGVTRVLEVGCGGGHFAAALRAARPEIGYRGIDLVPENVDAAQILLPEEDFAVGGAIEYLDGAAVDWDFVVSIRCLFTYTDTRDPKMLFDLLNARAEKGFVVVTRTQHVEAATLQSWVEDAVASSTGVAASYAGGEREFLSEALLKDMIPVYVHRASTEATSPEVVNRYRVFGFDRVNKVLEVQDIRRAFRESGEAPATVTRLDISGGLVIGRETPPPDEGVITRMARPPRVEPDS